MPRTDDLIAEVKQARAATDTATVVLTAAAQRGLIGEVPPDRLDVLNWESLSEDEKQALLTWPGKTEQIVAELEDETITRKVRPDFKTVLRAACKMAGTTFEQARAAGIAELEARTKSGDGGAT